MPQRYRQLLDRIAKANDDGMVVRGQVAGRPTGIMAGFRMSRNPFMGTEAYKEIAHLHGDARIAALADPKRRARILKDFPSAISKGQASHMIANFNYIYEYGGDGWYAPTPDESLGARAKALGVDAASWTYDLLLKDDGRTVLYLPAANSALATCLLEK